MNNEGIFDFVLAVEEQLTQDGVEFEKYAIIFRVFLYFSFRTKPLPKPKNYFSLFRKILWSPYDIWAFKRDYANTDVLLVSPAQNRNVKLDTGELINKHIEGLSAHFNDKRIMKIEVGGGGEESPNNLTLVAKIFSQIIKNISNQSQHQLLAQQFSNACLKVAASHSIDLSFKPIKIKNSLAEFSAYKLFYQCLLAKRTNAETACFIAYYNLQNLALIEVLKARNIKTIDYQHGIQNDFHPMYTGVQKNHLKEICGIPNEFWVWDRASEKRAKASFERSQAVVTGNLWNNTETFKSIVSGHAKPTARRVLVALQLWPDFFNFDILQVIEDSSGVEWIFREHPISPLPDEKKRELISKYKIQFEDISRIPVESSILNADICITGFSTVGIEAHQLGKKVIFVHENALLGLSAYIDQKEIFFAKDSASMTNIITTLFGE